MNFAYFPAAVVSLAKELKSTPGERHCPMWYVGAYVDLCGCDVTMAKGGLEPSRYPAARFAAVAFRIEAF